MMRACVLISVFRCISSFLLVCLFACLLAYWFRLLILGLKGPKVDRGIACDFIFGRCWQPPLSNASRLVSQRVKRCHPIRAASCFPNAPFAALILFQESISDDGPIYADKATTFATVGGYHTLTTWTAWFRECWHRTLVFLSNHISCLCGVMGVEHAGFTTFINKNHNSYKKCGALWGCSVSCPP